VSRGNTPRWWGGCDTGSFAPQARTNGLNRSVELDARRYSPIGGRLRCVRAPWGLYRRVPMCLPSKSPTRRDTLDLGILWLTARA